MKDNVSVEVPDDVSGLTDEQGGGLWHSHERLVLKSGGTVTRRSAAWPYEPHLGDVMGSAGHRVTQVLAVAKQEGVLRFLPDDDGLMFVPLDNVEGIYVDVFGPDGEEIFAADIKPGYHDAADD